MSARTPDSRPDNKGLLDRITEYCPPAVPIRWALPMSVGVLVVLLRWFVLPGGEVGAFLQFLLAGAAAAVWYFRNLAGWLIMAAVAAFFFIVLLPLGAFDLVLLLGMGIGVWALNRHLAEVRQRARSPYVVESRDDAEPGAAGADNTVNTETWYGQQ